MTAEMAPAYAGLSLTMRTHVAQKTLDALRSSHLRPTRQRTALANLIFAGGNRHITADIILAEARRSGVMVSLATIYNTLHQFSRLGLLREIAVDGRRTYFDTNTTTHHHFFVEDQGRIIDVPLGEVSWDGQVDPPNGFEMARIDIVIRLRAILSPPSPSPVVATEPKGAVSGAELAELRDVSGDQLPAERTVNRGARRLPTSSRLRDP